MDTSPPSVNYAVRDRDFKYYIFDWDDNILHMPTRIHLEALQPDGTWAPHQVSTSLFSVIRTDTEHYRPPGGDWKEAFIEFRTAGDPIFLEDTRRALLEAKQDPASVGPSFKTFRQTLVEGRIFAIVTARGHAPETIRQAVIEFIDIVLTPEERAEMMANLRGYRACFDHVSKFGTDEQELDYYLGLNRYHPVTSPDFAEKLNSGRPLYGNAEEGKRVAIRDFVEHVVRVVGRTAPGERRPFSIGFSDDDPRNVAAVQAYIERELSIHFPSIKFCVYDTSDASLPNGRKVVVSGQLDFGF
ncbi:MAG: hypothetical protein ACOX5G_13500 [Kiritimatiellia bacterium]|jgi:hypothetical protein